MLYLRDRWPRSRILISKMDVAEAFRQVHVTWAGNQVFAYSFEDWIVVDRRLMFGWKNSPGFFCLFSDALRHSHTRTAWPHTSVSPCGAESTKHVRVPSADPNADQSKQTPLPQGFNPPPREAAGG